ncbi:hypothetical protein V2G26_020991 [Clonostachys chloroleuca]
MPSFSDSGPLYLGFDLSTQQLKAVVVDSNLQTVGQAKVDFDGDFAPKYGVKKGVHVRESTGEVYAPVAMWMDSLDLVLSRLASAMPVPMERIRAVSGSGQQHGSVFWNSDAESLLGGSTPPAPSPSSWPPRSPMSGPPTGRTRALRRRRRLLMPSWGIASSWLR